MTDVDVLIDAGLLPFVPCDHDSNGVTPSNVVNSLIGWVCYCAECLSTWRTDEVQWLTPREARQRFGWTIRPDTTSDA